MKPASITMYEKLITGSILSIPLLITACSQQNKRKNLETEQGTPNIIFIMSDDHDRQAISAYGGNLIQTPYIDKIAKGGMLFRNCFVTNSISGPSRAVLLTGKHSHINGFTQNEKERFDSSQVTFPKLFQQNGYQTAIIGKWHLESQPTGFDYWNILPNQGDYYNPDFIDNGERKRVSGYVTNIITDKALEWLDSRNRDKPFMLMIHNKAPHRNWEPDLKDLELYDTINFETPSTFFDDYHGRGRAAKEQEMTILNYMWPVSDLKMQPEIAEKYHIPGYSKNQTADFKGLTARMNQEQQEIFLRHYRKRDSVFQKNNPVGKEQLLWKYQQFMKDYLRCIHSVDENVGRLLRYLDSTGLAKNTIIVYTSDQGFYLGNHGWFDKRFMYEESFHTPFIVRWPGVTDGTENTDLVQNLDWAETLLSFAGIPIPSDMQGISLVPYLEKKKPDNFRDAIYYHYYEFPVWHHVYPHFGIRTDRYKLIYFYTIREWEFYDLVNDPQEMSSQYLNPDYLDTIKEMKKRLKELQTEYKDQEGLDILSKISD